MYLIHFLRFCSLEEIQQNRITEFLFFSDNFTYAPVILHTYSEWYMAIYFESKICMLSVHRSMQKRTGSFQLLYWLKSFPIRGKGAKKWCAKRAPKPWHQSTQSKPKKTEWKKVYRFIPSVFFWKKREWIVGLPKVVFPSNSWHFVSLFNFKTHLDLQS